MSIRQGAAKRPGQPRSGGAERPSSSARHRPGDQQGHSTAAAGRLNKLIGCPVRHPIHSPSLPLLSSLLSSFLLISLPCFPLPPPPPLHSCHFFFLTPASLTRGPPCRTSAPPGVHGLDIPGRRTAPTRPRTASPRRQGEGEGDAPARPPAHHTPPRSQKARGR